MARPIKAVSKPETPIERVEKKSTNKRIRIAGNAVILTSKLDFATIQKMEKYNRDALCLTEIKNDEEYEIFRIGTGKSSSISKYGITFMEANKQGKATATILLPEGVTDKKAYIKDNYASAIFMLNDLEEVVKTACAALEAAYAKLDADIEED